MQSLLPVMQFIHEKGSINRDIAVCKKVRTGSKMEKELKEKKWEQHIQKI
jgi:hypothetical protein